MWECLCVRLITKIQIKKKQNVNKCETKNNGTACTDRASRDTLVEHLVGIQVVKRDVCQEAFKSY